MRLHLRNGLGEAKIPFPSLGRDLMALFILTINLLPGFRYFNPLYYAFFCFVWFVFALLSGPNKLFAIIINKVSIIIYLWLSIFLIYFLLGHIDIGFIVKYGLIGWTLIIFLYYFKLNNKRVYTVFLLFAMIYFLFTSIDSLYILNMYPHIQISRILASGDSQLTDQFSGLFIGGYSFTYQLMLIIICFSGLLKNRIKNKKIERAAFALLLLFVFTLYKADYAMAIILTGIFSIIAIFGARSRIKNVMIASVSIIGLIVFYPLMINFLYYLSNAMTSSFLATRLGQVAAFLDYGGVISGNSLSTRIELYMISFNTFLSNPVYGVGSLGHDVYSKIGGHSEIFDYMGYFGSIGFIVLIFMVYRLIVLINRWLIAYNKQFIFNCCVGAWGCFLFLNPGFNREICTALFFIIPILLKVIDLKPENQ